MKKGIFIIKHICNYYYLEKFKKKLHFYMIKIFNKFKTQKKHQKYKKIKHLYRFNHVFRHVFF